MRLALLASALFLITRQINPRQRLPNTNDKTIIGTPLTHGARGSEQLLRLRDPRRFGAVLWQEGDAQQHSLLASLGPEPLSEAFTTEHLYQQTRQRRAAIKLVLMDHHMVVGVGNIYASEALFRAGIRPTTRASKVSLPRARRLHAAIREVLARALEAGGSTLRDFSNAQGQTGYFQLETAVYDRAGEPCKVCEQPIRQIRQGQRSTFYCIQCQKP